VSIKQAVETIYLKPGVTTTVLTPARLVIVFQILTGLTLTRGISHPPSQV
jgi:hypothetical protein